ncbi:MAG: aldo/keto reductase [Chloroflexi bacterium]|nr:aldo/keto reductase [Chloroflexota bacterium]MCY3582878.1 aldo/keto reductase [Chloroflexota bacterium]MCY3716590.1 aldo/keto reductase [Chloroflexota bacterium]MDE2650092.1 aldo/keto reductase [Chloroflexota bacterium]MXX51932.1 aldo/keto reductase [Chloroflexota bacterium]
MKYATIPGVAKPVARLLQGTVMLTADTRDSNFRLLDACFEHGFNTFDTAHGYGGGVCERELGAWIKARGIRDQVVILTKGAHPYSGEPDRVAPEFIRRDLEESLERLGTDFVELYLLHRDSRDTPVDEIVDVLHEAKAAGHIGVYGGSNWLADRVAAANAYAAENSKTPFGASSPQFSIAEMIEPPWAGCISVSGAQGEADRRWYDANEISLFTWSSLAGGFMTGKFRRDNLAEFSNYWDTNPIGAYAYESNFQRLDRALELAADKGASPAQIGVAYVLSNNARYHAIVANWETEQIPENAAAADIQLSADEIAWLELKTEDKPQ